jgi:membrane-associated protease RseP (regulator of RpoE activity)
VFGSGYLNLGRWRGAVIRLHWSILLGAVIFGGFRFDPVFLVGYVGLVLLHEIGHALVVWRYGHSVTIIEATGFGGTCHWSGNATPFEESAIAWGGVLAQAALLAGAYAKVAWGSPPASATEWTLIHLATSTNLWLITVNLMPVPPLDGAKAWQLFANWRRRGDAGVPFGSWKDSTSMSQRAWFDGVTRASKRRRPKAPKRIEVYADPVDPEGELNPDAKRAIDDMLAKVRAEASVKKDDGS